ncbi:MAG: four helix bundle protein [bacterium]|nr:four helix bundle protein [bacterium]
MTYHDLKSYKQAEAIHDFTVEFCKQYISPKSRTIDQMEQAARSGKQNIAEGCSVSKTSPKNELFLLGVARGSLKELLEDYNDYLRQHDLKIWPKDDARTVALRRLPYMPDRSYGSDKSDRTDRVGMTYMTYKTYINDAESACNTMVTLINQTVYLLDQQIAAVKKQMGDRGVVLETQEQKIRKMWEDNKKKSADLDRRIREILEKARPWEK